MAMKLKTDSLNLANYEEKKKAFYAVLREKPEDAEAQNAAHEAMNEALAADLIAIASSEAERMANERFDAMQGAAGSKLTAEEVTFFKNLTTDVGYKEEILLPQTTIDRIFEDLKQSHPLLAEINLQSAGLRLKFLKSETNGVAVWGKIFGEIKGQLDAAFSEEEDIQSKLTAFVVVPKDLQDFGPNWVETYVRTQIVEAFSYQLVLALVNGDGNDKPVGLRKNTNSGAISGGVTTYTDKTPTGTLTFADADTTIQELTGVMNELSTKENGKQVAIDGKVILICNPSQAWALKAQYTIQNANGVFITALPFNVRIVEAEGAPVNEVIAFVKGRYDAFVGGGTKISKYDQTLAMEDCDLYTAKSFYYGKARDNKAALIYTLGLPA